MVRFIKVLLRNMPALGLAIGLSGCVSRSGEGEGWVGLFNGRDLAGWTVKCQRADQGKTFWTVDEGAIVCDSVSRKDHNYVWLMTDAG